MKDEVMDEKLQYAIGVCRKYNRVKIIAEEAEAAWRLNLEMIAGSKYPSEKEMYEQQAEEELAKYTAAREWMKLVLDTTFRIKEFRAQEVIRQHCLNRIPLKSVEFENGKCMGKTAVFYYKKIGMQQFSIMIAAEERNLKEKENKLHLI